MGQLCVGPSPAPPLPCTATVTCLLPALPQAPMFCVVFVSLLLNWGRGGAGRPLWRQEEHQGKELPLGTLLVPSFLEVQSRRDSVLPPCF